MQIQMPQFDARTVGALAIAVAGLVVGFSTGRLSAWLVPIPTHTVSTGPNAKPPIPLDTAATIKAPGSEAPGSGDAAKMADPGKTTDPGTPQAETKTQANSQTQINDQAQAETVGSRALGAEEPAGEIAAGGEKVTLINPNARDDRTTASKRLPVERLAAERPLDDDQSALARCAQKYRSFDAADGTYQPFGQNERVRCPHLRQ